MRIGSVVYVYIIIRKHTWGFAAAGCWHVGYVGCPELADLSGCSWLSPVAARVYHREHQHMIAYVASDSRGVEIILIVANFHIGNDRHW